MRHVPNIRFAVRTLGCKVNQYESQVLRENLERFGYRETDEKNADAVIINSCTVTEQADIKTRKLVRKIKKGNPAARILVTGCYAVHGDDIDSISHTPGVCKVVPNEEKMRLPVVLNSIYNLRDDNKIKEEVSGFRFHTRAFVKIQDGCSQDCSYCKVRLVRGPSRSRDKREVLDEIARLAGRGYREIVITGICLGSWRGASGQGLSELLQEIQAMKGPVLGRRNAGEFRIRLSSLEPNHINKGLIETIARSGRICKHLHIPLQSGSDRILALMRRRYNTSQFRRLIGDIRSRIPFAGITLDMIAGFPGETEDDFSRSVELVKELAPSRLHVFRYSDRKGTLSAEMEEKVPSGIIRKRVESLMKIGNDLQLEFCRKFTGREVEVLVEKGDPLAGYISEYVKVKLTGISGKEGNLIRVRPAGVDESALCLFA